MTVINSPIDFANAKKAAHMLRAVNNKRRQKILEMLSSKGESNVTAIFTELNMEQSEASQHLGLLRKHGIVESKRSGKQMYYTINAPKVSELNKCLESLKFLP